MILKNLEVKDIKYQGMTCSGFSIKANLIIDAYVGPTTYGSSLIDWSKVNIKVILNRAGVDNIIAQDNLRILGLSGVLNQYQQIAHYAQNDHLVKLANGRALVAFDFPLMGHINVSGSDYLYLEVTCNTGFFPAGYYSGSYLEIKPIQSIGYEHYIPSVRSYSVLASTTAENYQLGSNVLKSVLLNLDKLDFQTPVVQNLTVTSDKLNDSFNFQDLVNQKFKKFGLELANLADDQSTLMEFPQSFVISEGSTLNKLILSFQFDGTQINAAKNYIVVWSYKTCAGTLTKATALKAKHLASAKAAIPAGNVPA